MEPRALVPYTFTPQPAGILSRLFFTPATESQIRQKAIDNLRKSIPKLIVQSESLFRLYEEARSSLSRARIIKTTKETLYKNQYMVFLLNCSQLRTQMLDSLPENLLAEAQRHVVGEDREEYRRSVEEGLNLVDAQFKSLFPSGWDHPVAKLDRLRNDYNRANSVYEKEKASKEKYESLYEQIQNSLKEASESLARLEAAVSQETPTPQVVALLTEFE